MGVFATWRDTQFPWDPDAPVNAFAQSFFQMHTSPDTWFEMLLDTEKITSSVFTYGPEWEERTSAGVEVTLLGTAPRDNSNHTYMALRKSGTSQWTLFYDFDPVAETQGQVDGIAPATRMDIGLITTAEFGSNTIEYRPQFMTGNSVWKRFDPANISTNQWESCDVETINCFNGSITTDTSGIISYNAQHVRSTSIADSTPDGFSRQPDTGVFNGVDQGLLAKCIAESPETCLKTVPGLAACVAAARQCNRAATSNSNLSARLATHRAAPLGNADSARTAAAHEWNISEADLQVRLMSPTQYEHASRTTLAPVWMNLNKVWVAHTDRDVAVPKYGDQVFHGLEAVYDAAGDLLHLCLGSCTP